MSPNSPARSAARQTALLADERLSGFSALLFGRSDAEDLAHLDLAAIDRLTVLAQAHLAEPRLRGQTHVSLADLDVAGVDLAGMDVAGPQPRQLTIVEIVNDNMPFLLDSTLAELAEQGFTLRLVAHPILRVERNAQGGFKSVTADSQGQLAPGERRESLIHIQLDRIDDDTARTRLLEGLDRVYRDVRRSVEDFPVMRARVFEAVQAFRVNPPPLPPEETAEALALLDWMLADNFTFLGVREYRFPEGEAADADPIEGTGLGILKDPDVKVLRRGHDLVTMTPEVRAFLAEAVPLIVTKANVKSRVHRRVHMDYVGVKLFGVDGALSGELRIVGLFTASAYTSPPQAVPYVRRKVDAVLAMAGFDPASYAGRALINVLESYPRDELFQIEIGSLYDFALDILTLSERPRVRVLPRVDRFDRFVSVIVYIPKDRYDTEVRRRVGAYLADAYRGRMSASYPAYPDGPLARTHYIIGRDEGATPHIPRRQLEEGILDIVRSWGDALRVAAGDEDGPRARAIAERFGDAFGPAYRASFDGRDALGDIAVIERLTQPGARDVRLVARPGKDDRAGLKVYARGERVSLSQRVPVLENLGFSVLDESTYEVRPAGETDRIFLHDMTLARAAGGPLDVAALAPQVEAALMAQFGGLAESDRYDALVLEAGLGWRDVALVRALGRYLQQARIRYGQDYIALTLARHPAIASDIVALFHARFDPHIADTDRPDREGTVRAALLERLKSVTSLDEDRILRRLVNLIDAAVRTSFYQRDAAGAHRETIAFKFESRRIDALPAPRPLYEIFVYSPRVEGVHLRFGKVARGGLRWSDRPQDFRTEVLGLVKAQQVKNAVIVPVGAKGGFVPKRLPPPAQRDAWLAEGTQSYRIFVRTLLEMTDNIDGDAIVPPALTVRHDGDDPYLVVAADKGTATFSDTANALSLDKGHWLGDAFASGGSQGYDHKKMGITARGAWEAVKRHFREIDQDIQAVPFTVAGVGDMSGDVFGNGMLLSQQTRLVAAFDHRDIFIDPNPDAAISFAERQRLFDLPRSSWQDYDTALISKGGGVFPRAAKAIPLSPEMRALLEIDRDEAAPSEIMIAILKARVDLLWFGGIGTYIRASGESDEEVGDRANDAIRIAGTDVRARAIGEGANLGATQRGRIEAALAGIRLNTDAIDNSAGVNTSDVEVNIKIALARPERDGRLDSSARNALLSTMTEEVAGLVLRNNYLQSLALSLSQTAGLGEMGSARSLMRRLEKAGRLDRSVEYLPDDAALAARERRGEALTRPELAVLLAYAKLAFHDAILESDAPDDPYFGSELTRYFPSHLRERFPDAIETHRLRREIVSTQLANAVINRGGPMLAARLADETGAEIPAIARAYALTRDAFGLLDINLAIDALDARMGGAAQLALYGAVQKALIARMIWFLRNIDLNQGLVPLVARFKAGVATVATALPQMLDAEQEADRLRRITALTELGAPAELAARIVDLPGLETAPDGVLVAERTGSSVADAVGAMFALAGAFEVGAIKAAADQAPTADRFERLAVDRARDAIDVGLRRMAIEAAAHGPGAAGVEVWLNARAADAERTRAGVRDLMAGGLSQAKLTLVANLIGDLARA